MQVMLKEIGSSTTVSFDGAASSSATVHHMSPPPSRNEDARRPASAQKKTSPASSNSSEDRRRSVSKVKEKAAGSPLEYSETGKIRWHPASAEGFFKGQRSPIRMVISKTTTSPGSPHYDMSLDEAIHLSIAYPCHQMHVIQLLLTLSSSLSCFVQRKVLNLMRSESSSPPKKRPISAGARSLTQSEGTIVSVQEQGLPRYLNGGWDLGGNSVRPASAPPRQKNIKVIDKRRGDRRKPAFPSYDTFELDQVVDRIIKEDEKVDLSRDALSESTPTSAQAASIKSNKIQVHNPAMRCSSEGRSRDSFQVQATPSVFVGNHPLKNYTEINESQLHADYYHRTLKELSSPRRRHVRITAKPALVSPLCLLSLALLCTFCFLLHQHQQF